MNFITKELRAVIENKGDKKLGHREFERRKSERPTKIVKEHKGRQLGRAAAWNSIVFDFHCKKAGDGVNEFGDGALILRGFGFPKRAR